jgi:hypothetical protein
MKANNLKYILVLSIIFHFSLFPQEDKSKRTDIIAPAPGSKTTDTEVSVDTQKTVEPTDDKKSQYPKSNLEWDAADVKELNWSNADKFCKDKNMRLPTKEELKYAYQKPEKEIKDTQENFWSSEYAITKRANTWYVNFSNGMSNFAPRSKKLHVVCVKGSLVGEETDENNAAFQKAEIEDGLVVQKPLYRWQADLEDDMNYPQAEKYCSDKGLRLPTRSELLMAFESKIDKLRESDGDFITSSPAYNNRGDYWYVSFKSGFSNPGKKYGKYKVRCIKIVSKSKESVK